MKLTLVSILCTAVVRTLPSLGQTSPDEGSAQPNVTSDSCSSRITLYQSNTSIPGSYGPITTSQTVTEFYSYAWGAYHGEYNLPIAGNRSVIAIHQDNNTCLHSLVVVHSAPFQGSLKGGSLSMYITGELFNPKVKDDPEFSHLLYHDDEYDNFYERRLNKTLVFWNWFHGDTDGLAHTMVENWEGCMEVEANFFAQPFVLLREPAASANSTDGSLLDGKNELHSMFFGSTGTITEWKFVSTNNELTDLKLDEVLTICIGDADPSNPGPTPFSRESTEGVCENLGEYTQPICGLCEREICHWHIWCNIAEFLNCKLGMNVPISPPPFLF